MVRILVVDDDCDFNRSLSAILRMRGYAPTSCFSAEEAFDVMEHERFDLIISDIMMKDMDGFEFAEAIRSSDIGTPILFLSALSDVPSKVRGFSLGIDDYLVKPVDFDELCCRIEALLRRARIMTSKRVEAGGFVMDSDEHSARLNGREIALTAREFSILFRLLSSPQKTFTRTELMDEFWDMDSSSGTRTVDVYITKLRAKLAECEDFQIVTVHGLGYRVRLK